MSAALLSCFHCLVGLSSLDACPVLWKTVVADGGCSDLNLLFHTIHQKEAALLQRGVIAGGKAQIICSSHLTCDTGFSR